ncbi:MAG: class I SAM-dependent DNA methyltransferase [Gemmatimonadales bacterium]
MRYTDSHKGKGADYHELFSPERNPYRAMIWRLEQRALDSIRREYLQAGPFTHLDFACGTGRILAYFSGAASTSTGVDVSPTMLTVARQTTPAAEFLEADLTASDVLGTRTFDLITAFRFFPNAEPELRQTALSILVRHLAPGGVIVFNNHKNRDSLRWRISLLRGRGSTAGTMNDAEVKALVSNAGLRVYRVVPLAILPFSEKHRLPIRLIEGVEHLLDRWSGIAPMAQDVIYVCGRDGMASGASAAPVRPPGSPRVA